MLYYGRDCTSRRTPPADHAVGRRGDRRARGGLRGRAAGGSVAHLGARQPRPLAAGEPPRNRPDPCGGGPAAHAAQDADAVLRRRARHAGGPRRARVRAGPVGAQRPRPGPGPRPRPHADALGHGAQRRVHGSAGAPMAAARGWRGRGERGRPARGPGLAALALPQALGAPARRAGARRGRVPHRTVAAAAGGALVYERSAGPRGCWWRSTRPARPSAPRSRVRAGRSCSPRTVGGRASGWPRRCGSPRARRW